jgi:hypothetical protein
MQPVMTAILPAVTAQLVIGYSWQDAHAPSLSTVGYGWDVAWRRFVVRSLSVCFLLLSSTPHLSPDVAFVIVAPFFVTVTPPSLSSFPHDESIFTDFALFPLTVRHDRYLHRLRLGFLSASYEAEGALSFLTFCPSSPI